MSLEDLACGSDRYDVLYPLDPRKIAANIFLMWWHLARRLQLSPWESNVVNRLLTPTHSFLARSKSTAALSGDAGKAIQVELSWWGKAFLLGAYLCCQYSSTPCSVFPDVCFLLLQWKYLLVLVPRSWHCFCLVSTLALYLDPTYQADRLSPSLWSGGFRLFSVCSWGYLKKVPLFYFSFCPYISADDQKVDII